MATNQKKNHRNPTKPTLQMLNEELTQAAAQKRLEIRTALGLKSEATVYRIINGERECKPHEQLVVAKIYGKDVTDINWKAKSVK